MAQGQVYRRGCKEKGEPMARPLEKNGTEGLSS